MMLDFNSSTDVINLQRIARKPKHSRSFCQTRDNKFVHVALFSSTNDLM